MRVYNNLFTVPEPTNRWEKELNTDKREVVYPNAMVDPSVSEFVDVKYVDNGIPIGRCSLRGLDILWWTRIPPLIWRRKDVVGSWCLSVPSV